MVRTQWVTYQLLTKGRIGSSRWHHGLPLPPNVWIGVSVENADYLWRIDRLRQVLTHPWHCCSVRCRGSTSGGYDWSSQVVAPAPRRGHAMRRGCV